MESNKSFKFIVNNYKPDRLDTESALRSVKERAGYSPRPKLLRPTLWIASVAAALILTFFVMPKSQNEWVEVVAGSEKMQYILPDSSVVTLYPNALIAYEAKNYDSKRRDIRLKGRAFFDVKRNERAVFEVVTNHSEVTVLGTSFEIEEGGDKTDLYVATGRVRFGAKGGSSVVIERGESASLVAESDKPYIVVSDVNPIAWVKGEFIYVNTPLDEVLRELSSYYGVKLSAPISSKALTATLKTDDLDMTLELIEEVLQVEITVE